LHGDTPWSIAVQLTNAQIDTYLNDRAAKGFTAILFNAIEHYFSSQSPAYRNVDGADPFTPMTDFSKPNNTYWNRIDYIVNQAKARGIACVINPAYLGYSGGQEGWMAEVNAATAAQLQSYGAWLANRYTQGNVIWCMGGDYAGSTTERDKQWNIATGIRSVRATDIIMAHPMRSEISYNLWGPGGRNYAGWNLNTTYLSRSATEANTSSATEYARPGPYPFVLIEAGYENEATLQEVRRAAYGSLLSGACGHFYGNNPLWGFGEPNLCGGAGPSSALSTGLNSAGAVQMSYLRNLLSAYQWHRLTPKTDTSLVSSSLGSGTTRVYPALSSDSTFAMIYVQDSRTVTIVMSVFSLSSVRVRLYNPTTGTFSAVGTFGNSGTQNIATTGERVIVLDSQ
jgi:hypothetical protein